MKKTARKNLDKSAAAEKAHAASKATSDMQASDMQASDADSQAREETTESDFNTLLNAKGAALNFGDSTLQAENKALQEQIAQWQDKALRAQAEEQNTRARLTREKQELQKYAVAPLAMQMFEVSDNLHQALAAIPRSWHDNSEWQEFIKGLHMIEESLVAAFSRCHIHRIGAVGEKFDYNLHQALSEVADSDADPGTIVMVVRHGYVLHQRLLRAASVVVAK